MPRDTLVPPVSRRPPAPDSARRHERALLSLRKLLLAATKAQKLDECERALGEAQAVSARYEPAALIPVAAWMLAAEIKHTVLICADAAVRPPPKPRKPD